MEQHSNSTSSIFFTLGVNLVIFIAKVEMADFTTQREMILAVNSCEKRFT